MSSYELRVGDMDIRRNPYRPGAGTVPLELAGRKDILDAGEAAIAFALSRTPGRAIFLPGLRGVGKTVLLATLERVARECDFTVAHVEAAPGSAFEQNLAESLAEALDDLSERDAIGALFEKARSVIESLRLSVDSSGDVAVGVRTRDVIPQQPIERDIAHAVRNVGKAAAETGRGLLIGIDEMQYLSPIQIRGLIMGMHGAVSNQLPVALIGAGLPVIRALTSLSRTYSERFEFKDVESLDDDAVRHALSGPAQQRKVTYDQKALEHIIEITQGYPYFVQEFGFHTWNVADRSPITLRDAQKGAANAREALDRSFFRVRLERTTPQERAYLNAMASIGEGPFSLADVHGVFKSASAHNLRASLIAKGLIFSATPGEIAFTVPLFADYLRRTNTASPTRSQRSPRRTS